MKKNLLMLLGVAVVFFSCQNDSEQSNVEEEQILTEAELLAQEDKIIVSDGEEDTTFQLNDESEVLAKRENSNNGLLTFGMSSQSKSDECEADLEGLADSLPESVSLRTTANPGDDAYFNFEILDTNLSGTNLKGWCGDVDGYLEVEGPYEFNVYSSYEDFPAEGNFENPQNFPLVNWIMNQDFIGQVSPISGETYTYGMVQWAIWELLDDQNCRACLYLTGDVDNGWQQNSAALEAVAMEIVDAAIENGQDYVPGCGEQVALIYIAKERNALNQIIQSVIQMVDVPQKETPCNDCEGDVDELTLKYEWLREKRVKIYQKKENTCWGVKIFDKVLAPGEEFTLEGVNHDGTFGKYIYIYINHCYYTKMKTNCYLNIGPGYERGVFTVVNGTSTHGGELCEYVKPRPKHYCRWWWSSYYN